MKNMYRMLGMFAALAGCVPAERNPVMKEYSKVEKEVDDVCSWLKCSKKELYLKAKANRKLLSEPAFLSLEDMYGKEGGLVGEYVNRELEDCDMQHYDTVHTDMLVDDLKKEMEGLL